MFKFRQDKPGKGLALFLIICKLIEPVTARPVTVKTHGSSFRYSFTSTKLIFAASKLQLWVFRDHSLMNLPHAQSFPIQFPHKGG